MAKRNYVVSNIDELKAAFPQLVKTETTTKPNYAKITAALKAGFDLPGVSALKNAS